MKYYNREKAQQLRIYILEQDKIDGNPAYDAIVRHAMELGVKGATVFRGLQGYGCHHHLHSARLVTISENLPMLVEIIDKPEMVQKITEYLDEKLPEGLFTVTETSMYTGKQ